MKMPWLCRLGFHAFYHEGNCPRCGYRWHGKHAEPYRSYVRRAEQKEAEK